MCLSGAAITKAGLNANSAITLSGTMLDKWSEEVEGFICTATRKDWLSSSLILNPNFSGILADTASDLIAMKIIGYDMFSYPSRAEAQTILDVLRDNSERNMEILKDEMNREAMQ